MTDLQLPPAPMAPPNLPAYFFGMIMVCWGVSYATDDPLLKTALCGAMGALLAAQTLSVILLSLHAHRARRRWLAEVEAQVDWLGEQATVLRSWNDSQRLAAAQDFVRALTRYGNKN